MSLFRKSKCPTEAELAAAVLAFILASENYRTASQAYYASSDTKDTAEVIVRLQIAELRTRKICDAASAQYHRLWALYKKANGAA